MKILYFDMDNVLVDFQSAFKHLSADTLKEYEGRFDEVPGLFGLMEPMDDALDAYQHLTKKYDSYILSTAPWENPSALTDKLHWVKKYLGDAAYKRLILTHNKHLNIGDYLIDDRTKNGAGEFTGEHIHFGTDKFPDWKSVLDYLG
jgi:5'-nucleotidase